MRKPILCVCGDERGAHAHYRGGSDCALCGTCGQFRRQSWHPAARIPLQAAAGVLGIAGVLVAGAWILHGVALLFRAIP